jgi:class 3 adenylate cyclase
VVALAQSGWSSGRLFAVTLQDVRYARTGGIELAYTVTGDGPTDVVLVPGLAGHLEYNEETHFYRTLVARLPRLARLIVFDRRGIGLSGGTALGPLEEQLDDIRTVMDAAGSRSAAIIGCFDAGPLAIVFAAASPEHVERLVLWETAARTLVGDDYPIGVPPEDIDLRLELIRQLWGTGQGMLNGTADVADEVSALRSFARLERNVATPSDAAMHFERYWRTDVRDVLPLISAPTFVLHSRRDPLFPDEHAVYMAERIPDAELRLLDGCGNHASLDPAWGEEIADEIEQFLTGSVATTRAASRVLATVLFTDIAGSTERASVLGDDNWKDLLAAHDRVAFQAVGVRGGQVVKSTGDGLLATFDGPGRGIDAALTIVRDAAALGLSVRAGLHTGEIVVRGDDVSGIAVNLASRIQSAAEPGTVLVSNTVVDLVVGSGHDFLPAGRRTFTGIDREWDLYVATR